MIVQSLVVNQGKVNEVFGKLDRLADQNMILESGKLRFAATHRIPVDRIGIFFIGFVTAEFLSLQIKYEVQGFAVLVRVKGYALDVSIDCEMRILPLPEEFPYRVPQKACR